MKLPILGSKDIIVEAVRENPVTIIVGETGSGKTTQIPVFLYEAGLINGGKLGVTQPRRIAAISVAEYVAGKIGTNIGDLVGYQIRFEDKEAENTKIKFMTDGILLRELLVDPDLKKYSVIMVDEAHERSQNIDFTLGLLKDLLKRRDNLRVVVTSATIDQEKFSRYFNDALIINVSGRTYPVEISWSEYNYPETKKLMEAVTEKIFSIHFDEEPGDILVFVAGGEHIDIIIKSIEEKNIKDLIALPAHGGLPPEEQRKIFNVYPGKRKIVVATNVAETSITLDGVVYVIDSGLIKQTNFHPNSGIQSLDLTEHSQSGCDQRKGRAGRTKPGICYRLYTEDNFNNRPRFTKPEILRTGLANVVLLMEDIGIENIVDFDFVDNPEREAFSEAYETLIAIGAINKGVKGLTDLGKQIARLPLEPHISKMVLEAVKYKCVEEVATIAAFLSARNIFARPKGKEISADIAHIKFKNPESDALTFLTVWDGYKKSRFSDKWCFDNFLNARALREMSEIREQLLDILLACGIDINSKNGNPDKIMKAVAMGLAYNLFVDGGRNSYNGVLRKSCNNIYIHPGSSIFGEYASNCIVAAKILQTKKNYAHIVTKVKLSWLPDLAPKLCIVKKPVVDSFDAEKGEAILAQEVFLQERKMGRLLNAVSIEEAIAVQTENIFKAEQNGLIPLTFKKYGMEEIFDKRAIAEYGGESLKLWNTDLFNKIEEGIIYYCRIKEFIGRRYAEFQFRVFNFPLTEETSGRIVADGLKELANKFNKN